MTATDHFALLGEPRRPWLDVEMLKEKFHQLARECHPDRVHGSSNEAKDSANQRHTELNHAFTTLRETKERLAHLLELEGDTKPSVVQEIPASLMNLCMDVGALCQRVDSFLASTPASESPMLQAGRFAQSLEHQDAVQAMMNKLCTQLEAVDAELRELNHAWETAPNDTMRAQSLPLKRIEELWRLVSYLTRWTAQLQERNVRLAF